MSFGITDGWLSWIPCKRETGFVFLSFLHESAMWVLTVQCLLCQPSHRYSSLEACPYLHFHSLLHYSRSRDHPTLMPKTWYIDTWSLTSLVPWPYPPKWTCVLYSSSFIFLFWSWEVFLPASPIHHGSFMYLPRLTQIFCSLSQICYAAKFCGRLQWSLNDWCYKAINYIVKLKGDKY